MQQQDSQMHSMGLYVMSAVTTAIERNFAGKKAKSEYIREPLLSKVFENDGLTEKQIQEKEIRKALLNEQKWITAAQTKGMPKTVIK